MTGPIARNPLPGEPEWRDRWQGALCAVCGHSRGTHESLPADHRFVPRPNGDPGRAGDSDTAPDWRDVHDVVTAISDLADTGRWVKATDVLRLLDAAPSVPPQPTVPRVVYDPQTHTVLVDIESDCGQGDFIGDVLPHQVVLRATSSVPPLPTVPRAPVEALIAAIENHSAPSDRVEDAVDDVRRHLNGDTT